MVKIFFNSIHIVNSDIEKIKNIVLGKPVNPFSFKIDRDEITNLSDLDFKKLVEYALKKKREREAKEMRLAELILRK